ncbi:hypothetical protein NQ315_016411 [Exocentrus adspersus]|uniref:Protein quiver n=1 Tax=Exocentrus adspersus TaxID=1586481 RepID=A0AAV8VRB0_9CUCU|nr:hypothetical protein NQ315_016411 [Exocentrus adspersus]
MSWNLSLLLSSLIVGPENSGLTCYECSQPKGVGLPCELSVESVPQTACAAGTSCIKYVWTNAGTSIVYRHCTSLTCDVLQQNSTAFNRLETCQTCNVDLCNKAVNETHLFVIIVMLSVLFHVLLG